MASSHGKTKLEGKQIELDPSSKFRMLPIAGLVLGVVGLGGAYAASAGDTGHFWYAYLTGFMFALALSLGGLFFVIIQHLVRAGWSIVVRRTAEHMAIALPIVALLGMGIVFSRGEGGAVPSLFEWSHDHVPYETTEGCDEIIAKAKAAGTYVDPHAAEGEGEEHDEPGEEGKKGKKNKKAKKGKHGGHVVSCYKEHSITADTLINNKRAYLNVNSFTLRYFIYFFIWTGLAFFFWRGSTQMDTASPDEATRLAGRMRFAAAPALLAFALSLTFAAFDFLMSLDPHWFSTIFGVYFFTGAAVSTFSFLAVILAALQAEGHLKNVVTPEHYHDLGKFMFGFTVFWAYIGFSQYFLIWYADVPEETHWFWYRGHGGFMTLSLILVFGRFVLPWFSLLRREVKRSSNWLVVIGSFILIMEFVDIYWLTAPAHAYHSYVAAKVEGNYTLAYEHLNTVRFGAVDILAWLGAVGVFLAAFGWSMGRNKLIPVNDPRIEESIHFENF